MFGRTLVIGMFTVSLLMLVWCGRSDIVEDDKLSFIIQAVYSDDLETIVTRDKVWSLMDQQQITVTAQAAGRVSSIPGTEWQDVLSWQPIISLADTVASYNLQAERARNNLDRAIAQEAQTRLTLEDAIVAAEAWLVQAQETLRIAQAGGDISLRTQELSSEQARIASESQLESVKISFSSEYDTLRDLLVDVLDRGDSILGVTDRYRGQNEAFRILLSAKDTQQRIIAENQLFALYAALNTVENIDQDNILWSLSTMTDTYNQINTYLAQMQQVFINTVTAVNLPEAQLNGFVQTFAGLQTRTQWSRAWFTAFRNQAINTLSDIDGLLAGSIWQESAALGLESARLNTENNIINAELALANAERAYIQAQNNKEKQAVVLATQVQDAQIALQDALRQLAKLTVGSPVRGALGEILVSVWQEVQPGTPLFSVIGTDRQLLQFTVNERELPYLRVGQDVLIVHRNDTISWSIQSVPRVANNSMQYRVVVAADRALGTFGGTVRIQIPVDIQKPLLPLTSINGIQAGQGIINVLNTANEIQALPVALGQTRWSMIELLSEIPDDYKIITNDISTYDPNDFELDIVQ